MEASNATTDADPICFVLPSSGDRPELPKLLFHFEGATLEPCGLGSHGRAGTAQGSHSQPLPHSDGRWPWLVSLCGAGLRQRCLVVCYM